MEVCNRIVDCLKEIDKAKIPGKFKKVAVTKIFRQLITVVYSLFLEKFCTDNSIGLTIKYASHYLQKEREMITKTMYSPFEFTISMVYMAITCTSTYITAVISEHIHIHVNE
ncbi:Hypothetical predicted protein [Octopus vulgaris]|uniref:Uncharacterized protein n=1 Tax=Octopus vulgaris TaxID=6645 RepID=A0AA36AKY7_OCTVU|nr:Hypothetical predicted protein [Octopus vulgaris]